jgi:hypothetical protein
MRLENKHGQGSHSVAKHNIRQYMSYKIIRCWVRFTQSDPTPIIKVMHRGCPSRGPRDQRGIGRLGGNSSPKTRRHFHLPAPRIERNFSGDVSSTNRGNFAAQQFMKRLSSKNWRAKLLSVLRARLTLENWRAKVMSVLIATTVWYLIKKNVATTPSPSETSSPAPVTETR